MCGKGKFYKLCIIVVKHPKSIMLIIW
jgi:hypothetical protein